MDKRDQTAFAVVSHKTGRAIALFYYREHANLFRDDLNRDQDAAFSTEVWVSKCNLYVSEEK